MIDGNQEFNLISDLIVSLPTVPKLDWAEASQHCGLIERNIQFLKEKICSLHHSLPFEQIPGIMVVHMVLHIVKFVNGQADRAFGTDSCLRFLFVILLS